MKKTEKKIETEILPSEIIEIKESVKFISKLEANLNGFDQFTEDDKKELLSYLKTI